MVVTLQKTKAYPVGRAFNIGLFGDIEKNLLKTIGCFINSAVDPQPNTLTSLTDIAAEPKIFTL